MSEAITTTTGNRQPLSAAKGVQALCESPAIQARINDILGKRAPQFVSSIVQLTQTNTMLMRAEPKTIIAAAITAATLDLPINQNLGYAYVVPYKTDGKYQAQFQLGYKGLIQLAQRSGQFAQMNDFVVAHGALVEFDEITGVLRVDRARGDDSKEPDGYGFYFKLLNGFEKTVFWPLAKVQAHAQRFSQAYSRGYASPWKSDFDAMARKTVIKHALSKYAPLSVEMQQAVNHDQAVIDLDTGHAAYPDNGQPDFQDTDIEVAEPTDIDVPAEDEEQPAAAEPPAPEASPVESLYARLKKEKIDPDLARAWAGERDLDIDTEADAAKILKGISKLIEDIKLGPAKNK
ncbi:recombinase RecT [Ruficoccus amylovorans]|uniref:Recombinase RecT n=1 Tax=Ruficoccus amylovorans TaxID=1804625 RepID=A0A842HH17_9BACT|nr:recombinase RecT [Ruficoccus amylovorans]MBC2594916.1 recombinase RecT [Ruficoccus amylovorans]